jgi:phage terminase large subunit GpA-like protein
MPSDLLQTLDVNDISDFPQCYNAFRPFPPERMLHWCITHIVNDQGRPYDHHAYPHLAAPGGPMDAFDDPHVRTISEQFATRLGKTFFGLCALLYYSDRDPSPMLLASESQDALKRVMGRLYQMIYQRRSLETKLLTLVRKDHKQDHVRFKECSIRGAWARSAGSLADMNIKVGLANEVDKEGWTGKSTTLEGAPIKLFDDRFKDYQSVRKIIYECTPTVEGASRIERLRIAGTNCKYHVPCPHCGKYQTLRLGARDEHGKFDPTQNGRVEWDKTAVGKSDRDLARQTARYICVNGCEITNEHRAWMMRHGVWVPEGCYVDDQKAMEVVSSWCTDALDLGAEEYKTKWRGWDEADWIVGDPVRNGPDASYHLSSLYALSLSWGDVAAEFVACKDRPQFLRNFVNQWLGDTWAAVERKTTWEQLGVKIIDDSSPRFLVPPFASILTVGVDRQADKYVWLIDAWGPDRTHMTIGYGEDESLDEIIRGVCCRWYAHSDGGEDVKPSLTLVDSGFRPEGVYESCKQAVQSGIMVLPCKGSNKSLESDYRQVTLGKDTSMPGMLLVHVDTIRTQAWMDRVLHVLRAGDPGCGLLHAGTLEEHQDYLEQLLNDVSSTVLDATKNEREVWERINIDIPNDYRDCRRYSYVAMLLNTRGRPILPRSGAKQLSRSAVISPGRKRQDGRPWV